MVEKNSKKLSASFEENIRYMNEILPVKESFDIIRRDIVIGGKASVFYYIDGFIKDEVMLKIMDSFLSVPEEDMPEDAETFIQKQVPYVEVDIAEDFDDVIRNVLSGPIQYSSYEKEDTGSPSDHGDDGGGTGFPHRYRCLLYERPGRQGASGQSEKKN